MNKAIIIGNLTKDPDKRSTADGISVCSFTVAVNKPNKGAEATEPDFFRVTAWRKLADICGAFLSKGRKVMVCGAVELHTFTGQDGKQYSSMSITADDVEFLSPKGEQNPTVAELEKRDSKTGFVKVNDDSELPF